MKAELDHIFVMCSINAPEATGLLRHGFKEGSPNSHDGQGTACRRFFFQNSYLELLWVNEPEAAQGGSAERTGLWKHWSKRGDGASPFGIVLRAAAGAGDQDRPFATWPYKPQYLPSHLAIDVGRDTHLNEPLFFYLGFRRRGARVPEEPVAHAIPVGDITGVSIGFPSPGPRSGVAQAAESMGLLTFHSADNHAMQLTFDDAIQGGEVDLRPDLPIVLRW